MVFTNLALYYVCGKRPSSSNKVSSSSTTHHRVLIEDDDDSNNMQMPEIIKTNQPNHDVAINGNGARREYDASSAARPRRAVVARSVDSLEVSCCTVPNPNCGNGIDNGISSHRSSLSSLVFVPADNASPNFWSSLPHYLLLSACSSVIPCGYSNDYRSHHPRIKGGLFVALNYFFCMLWIGLALGLTIVNDVPNTFQGVSLPQPSLKVEVRE